MSLRSLWNGCLRCSLVTIPIRLYAAVEADHTPRFHQLHQTDQGRIGHDKKCRSCGDPVSAQEIVKGFEYGPDQYVVITTEDLQQLRLKSTKTIDLEHFVPADQVPATLFDQPYFIGPHGEPAAHAYRLLATALKERGQMGVGKVVLREREDLVFISPHQDGLILYKARYPQRLRDFADVPHLTPGPVPPEELELATRLVDARTTQLDQLDLHETYQQALQELIEAKLQGQPLIAVAPDTSPVLDLMSALENSLAQTPAAKKTKAARKTTRRKKAAPKKVALKKAAPKRAA